MAEKDVKRELCTTGRANRRAVGKMVVGLAAGAAALAVGGASARAEDFTSDTTGKCATCRYWGGVRKVSIDGKTVSADGKGWCNNPGSPAYQKQTNPSQGAPVWRKWDALD